MWSPSIWSCAWLLASSLGTALADLTDEVKAIPLRTHSLQAPYLDSDMQSRWFDFGGDTVIRTDQYIRLASDKPSRSGWMFSRVPLTATNWEIEFEFKIHGQGTLYGDGMALWLTKQRAQSGDVFGSVEPFEGLGIFFDTYKNNRPGTVFPYVMAMLGDGQTTYDKANDGKANELAGCSARGIRNAAHPTKARLTYFQDESLTMQLQYKNPDEWTDCFTLNGIKIPSVAYLGFSAETGELSDNHDIISLSTKNLYTPGGRAKVPNTMPMQPRPGRPARQKSGWGWVFVKFVIFGCVITGGYVGFTVYRQRMRQSRF